MNKHETSKFTYTKPNGDVSERTAFIISTPSDMFLALDLSEFDDDEREHYTAALTDIYADYVTNMREDIKQLGLSGNYRNFKDDRITPHEGQS